MQRAHVRAPLESGKHRPEHRIRRSRHLGLQGPAPGRMLSTMNPSERTIVVGVDYSDFCIPAVDEALRIASGAPGTRLVPLLALTGGLPSSLTAPEDLTKDVVSRSEENLLRLVEARAQALRLALPPVTPTVRFGLPAERLLSEAREQKASLLVVGTHGRRGLQHLLLGSVAEEVMRQAPCSVLVARSPELVAGALAIPRTYSDDRTDEEVDAAADEREPTYEGEAQVVTEPHLDAGRVVLHVLDVPSGQVFVSAFDDAETVRVDPLEGEWVPAPASAARARVARAALEAAARDRDVFEALFEELERQGRHRPITPG
jgi:nucleotide-binding universal stress UspA family protein